MRSFGSILEKVFFDDLAKILTLYGFVNNFRTSEDIEDMKILLCKAFI
jgi:hypothetical protein